MADTTVSDSARNADINLKSRPKSKLGDLIAKQLDHTDPTPLNKYEIRNYIYFGFSDEHLRPKYWKMLLDYYSPNQFKTEAYYKNFRQSYFDIQTNIDLESTPTKEAARIIDLDIHRTLLLQENTQNSLAVYSAPIKRILLAFSVVNSGIGYIQGMIGLILPLFHVMSHSMSIEDSKFAEEDAFFLFNNLMVDIGENFIGKFDNCSNGIRHKIGCVFEIIKIKDPVLYDHIIQKKLDVSMFPLKWIMLMFSSEFKLDDVLLLWDKILSDSYRFEILQYLCASAIILMRNTIINESFERCMEMFQNISIIGVEVLFDVADVLRRGQSDINDILKSYAQ